MLGPRSGPGSTQNRPKAGGDRVEGGPGGAGGGTSGYISKLVGRWRKIPESKVVQNPKPIVNMQKVSANSPPGPSYGPITVFGTPGAGGGNGVKKSTFSKYLGMGGESKKGYIGQK